MALLDANSDGTLTEKDDQPSVQWVTAQRPLRFWRSVFLFASIRDVVKIFVVERLCSQPPFPSDSVWCLASERTSRCVSCPLTSKFVWAVSLSYISSPQAQSRLRWTSSMTFRRLRLCTDTRGPKIARQCTARTTSGAQDRLFLAWGPEPGPGAGTRSWLLAGTAATHIQGSTNLGEGPSGS